jgi:hypothetical protein
VERWPIEEKCPLEPGGLRLHERGEAIEASLEPKLKAIVELPPAPREAGLLSDWGEALQSRKPNAERAEIVRLGGIPK